MALHLARRGATVVGLARHSDALVSLRDAAEHEELALVPIAADVTVPAEVKAAFDVVDTEFGPVTFAVTCAGTAEVIGRPGTPIRSCGGKRSGSTAAARC